MADIQVINGNMAAAIGAALCRPDIIAAYPITPQTPIVEYLAAVSYTHLTLPTKLEV